ncbi:MAG: hypothetical protein COB36_01910 [Alphaproteobacteria bacterium]|nr:MAG: hypothetical protein COB36_01910 [Alphaproteobacteria bacterium]
MGKSLVRKNHFSSIERGFTNFSSEEPLPHVEVREDERLNNALGRVYRDATVGDSKAAMDDLAEDMHDRFIEALNHICFPYSSADSRIKSVPKRIVNVSHQDYPLLDRAIDLEVLCDTATNIAKGYEDIGYEMDGGVAEYYLTKIHLAKSHLNAAIGDGGDIAIEDIYPGLLHLETLVVKSKNFSDFIELDRGHDL